MFAGIETGGTKIIARIVDADGRVHAEGRWPTSTPEAALEDLLEFFARSAPLGPLAGVGMASFGPLVRDQRSPDYGLVLETPKPGWTGANLRTLLAARLRAPVVIDTDVNAAACAEWLLGAGRGVRSLAYVTVGTGIGGGLVIDGRPLEGALHPEIGHIRLARREGDRARSTCRFHENCAEGLCAGPAIARRLGAAGRALADEPAVGELVAGYLGDLGAALVLAWSPERIVWGGGVMTNQLLERLRGALDRTIAGYGVGEAVRADDFCVPATLADAGLEGALLMARATVRAV